MREINKLVVHCSATPKGAYFDIEDIRKWHVIENGWQDVGYHFIVLLDGTIQLGRPLSVKGAHVSGHNAHSIGICYIGGGIQGKQEDTRTPEQFRSLLYLLQTLKLIFKDAVILGHKDFPNVTKSCPNFNVMEEYTDL